MKIIRNVSLILVLLLQFLISSCVQIHKPLSMEDRGKVSSANLYIFLQQQEIKAEIKQSNITGYMGGGLIWAITDSAINNKRIKEAEKLIQPIRDGLIDYNFGKSFEKAIAGQIETGIWPQTKNINIEYDSPDTTLDAIINGTPADSVLVIKTDYAFSPDFTMIKIDSKAELYLKGPKTDPIYKNKLLYTAQVTNAFPDIAGAIKYWSSEKSTKTRAILEHGVTEVARMVVYDLSTKNEEKTQTKQEIIISDNNNCKFTRLTTGMLTYACMIE